MGNNTIFKMKLEEMQVSTVQDCTHLRVKEISVVARSVDITVVKQLGAKHMFLVLRLEGDILIINDVSDGDGGKGAKVVFKKLPQCEINEGQEVLITACIRRNVTLQNVISYAKQYQIENPNYQIHSKNCQFYCIKILEKLHVEQVHIYIVANYSHENMKNTKRNGGIAAAILSGIGIGIYLSCKRKGANEGEKKSDEEVKQPQTCSE
ncbi:hypothetical protein TTHERM_01087790 (macronuclear) [Tetrahymena thermophila SB210]|uniref:Uncharacterized protein n=1 Tax=Tetrahymena thermophila (strain SB210) TaxID=312017 RepID=Q23M87_TETTS|nr:hypothetical protein TTHERM_01087790 [Tetrahymena thermophila SB210]EAR97626.1 hypothetical protein TTHERM_01087790 [Tetrahymena thermophila SB210]|eukprot:XP_001017871.1 hypothetical protein TTHERM_01087790 [Tetrahymena thermophila SB210]